MGLVIHSPFVGLGLRVTGGPYRPHQHLSNDVSSHRELQGHGRSPGRVNTWFCHSRRGHKPSNSGSKPPQDTVLEVLSEVAKADGRIAQTTNMVIGGTVTGASDEEWKTLNEKVNSYPTRVNFTAIGSGGDDFVQAMVGAVESVLQCPIQEEEVKLSLSSKGKYVSVRIGPVEVVSSDQVQAVYRAMKRDERMKYFL